MIESSTLLDSYSKIVVIWRLNFLDNSSKISSLINELSTSSINYDCWIRWSLNVLDGVQFWRRSNGWILNSKGFFFFFLFLQEVAVEVQILEICHFWILYYYFFWKIYNFSKNSSSFFLVLSFLKFVLDKELKIWKDP